MSDNQPVWQYPGWPEPPALHGDAGADVCVIGLGGSGLSCVGELLALGRSVVGLDAGPIGGGAAGSRFTNTNGPQLSASTGRRPYWALSKSRTPSNSGVCSSRPSRP